MSGMIFTFYSYKGGVGRSMALANIGVHFHQRGFRTLLIDMDLEAPGLERYFEGSAEFEMPRSRNDQDSAISSRNICGAQRATPAIRTNLRGRISTITLPPLDHPQITPHEH